jgi:hypothetical protein
MWSKLRLPGTPVDEEPYDARYAEHENTPDDNKKHPVHDYGVGPYRKEQDHHPGDDRSDDEPLQRL